MLADQGKLAEAIEHFQQAVRLNPANAAAQSNLANALRKLGMGKEDAAVSGKR
jgi:Flp pilus assembly protein TadD